MATTTDEIIIKVSIAKEQAAAALTSIKANISSAVNFIKKAATVTLTLGTALSSVFAIAKGGAFAFGFLNKIPGIALSGSKGLALIAGSTQLISKGAIQSKKGIDKLNQALSAVTGKEISLTPGKLKQIGKAAISATQGVFLLRTGITGLRKGFGPLGKIIGGITKRIFSMRTAFLALAGIGGILGLGNSVVAAASQMEDFRTRFVALTKSTDEAQQKISFLSRFAATVPFELPDIIKAGISLEAFGLKAEEGIKPLADLAAFMGTSIVDAASAMGRAFAAGAGAADVLRERGVLNLIKLRLGIDDLSKLTLPEFRKAMIDTFTDITGKVSGATKLLAKTLTGQTSMMTDAIFQLRVVLGEQLLPKIKELIEKRIVPIIKKTTEWIKVNEDLISLKFAEFIDDSIIKIQKFVKWAKEAAIETKKWWEENKELIFTLIKLAIAGEIAIKISSLVVAITGLGKVLLAAKLFVSGFLLTLVGAGGLFAAISVLSPQILILAGAVALLIGYKVGDWASDAVFGLDKITEATQKAQEKWALWNIKSEAEKARTALKNMGISIEEFRKLSDEELDKVIKKFADMGIDLTKLQTELNKAKNSLEGMGDAGKKAADDTKSAWEKTSEGIKKAFEALGIIPKKQFEAQVQAVVKNFEIIARSGELSSEDVITARAKMFEELQTLADKAKEEDILGIDIEDFKTRLDEVQQALISKTRDATRTLKDATGQDVTELFKEFEVNWTNASEVMLKGFTKDSATIADEAAKGIGSLFDETIKAQQDVFDKITTEVERLAEFQFKVEDTVTANLKEETKERLQIIKDFVFNAEAEFIRLSTFRLSKIPSLPPVGSESDLPLFVGEGFAKGINRVPFDMIAPIHKNEQIVPASQNPNNPNNQINSNNTDNRKFEINLNGNNARTGIGVEASLLLEQTLKNISRFDASLSQ